MPLISPTDDAITVLSTSLINSANSSTWQALQSPFPLGPLDHGLSHTVPVAVVLVYASSDTSSTDSIIPVDRLTHALSLVLDYYPHLTGRLRFSPQDGTPALHEFGTGAALVQAECSQPLSAFARYDDPRSAPRCGFTLNDLPGASNALLAPFDPALEAVERNPVFTLQHTRFTCGSVTLGVRVHHILNDAEGIFMLIRDLAELYRASTSSKSEGVDPRLSRPPCFRSAFADLTEGQMSDSERETALAFQPTLYHLAPPEVQGPTADIGPVPSESALSAIPHPASIGKFIRFTAAELAALKREAMDPSGEGWVSTFDALCAHLHQRIYRARLQLRAEGSAQAPLSPPDFLTPVDIRGRVGPPHFPPRHTGNSGMCTITAFDPSVLTDRPLWEVAKQLHDLTREGDVASWDKLADTLRWLAACQPVRPRVQQSFRYGTGSLMLSQWSKIDAYAGAAFDDRPILVSTPFTPISNIDGLGYFLPTERQGMDVPAEGVDIDVALALSAPVWDILERDPGWRRWAVGAIHGSSSAS